jgi:hypothetical protein
MDTAAFDDAARLDQILAKLDPADQLFLSERIDPPWRQRARRMQIRDDAVRDARAHFLNPQETCAAKELSAALARYLASTWQWEQRLSALDDVAEPQRAALFAIAKANSGKGLSWRRIVEIW